MATGIENRLKLSGAEPSEAEQDEFIKYRTKIVTAELDKIGKYRDASFEDEAFDALAHFYINACEMQLEALSHYRNGTLYDALWDGGYKARSGIIVALYEQYDLPITKEQADNYRAVEVTYTVTTETVEDESPTCEMKVESVAYDFDHDDGGYVEVKIRNMNERQITDVSFEV